MLKKNLLILLLTISVFLSFTFYTEAKDYEKKAILSKTKFIMDKGEVSFDTAYNIDDNNYIQLRSIAQMFNGTKSQFNVYWDESLKKAVIETGIKYTGEKIYKIGEKVKFDNTEITINKAFKTKSIGSNGVQTNYAYYVIDYTIKTSLEPKDCNSWQSSDFFARCNAYSGEKYFGKSSFINEYITPNKEITSTIYFFIKENAEIEYITVCNPSYSEFRKISVTD
jgi:hypothetical protein